MITRNDMLALYGEIKTFLLGAACGVLIGALTAGGIAWPHFRPVDPDVPKPVTPVRPDWLPPNPPPAPNPTPLQSPAQTSPVAPNQLRWQPLPGAPGWEGYGKTVDGQFLIQSWRRAANG